MPRSKVCPSAAWQRTGRSAAALLSAEESEGESKTSGSTSGGSGHWIRTDYEKL
jgi:replication restart DNA helicase PriA